jgi:ribonuclease HII
MKLPNFREEKKLWRKGFKKVVCLDESGRGCVAGPVVATAVMIKPKLKLDLQKLKIEVRDSKKLSPQKREEIFKILKQSKTVEWGIGIVSEKKIDKINIKNATELAMEKALRNLEKKIKKKVDFLIVDGNHLGSKKLKAKNHKLIVKADEKVFSCALASIVAKVIRDRMMKKYAKKFPQYGFEKHKGYLTKLHLKMLKKYGPCKIHRKSFTPCKIKKP